MEDKRICVLTTEQMEVLIRILDGVADGLAVHDKDGPLASWKCVSDALPAAVGAEYVAGLAQDVSDALGGRD